jgi:hypothetical protein
LGGYYPVIERQEGSRFAVRFLHGDRQHGAGAQGKSALQPEVEGDIPIRSAESGYETESSQVEGHDRDSERRCDPGGVQYRAISAQRDHQVVVAYIRRLSRITGKGESGSLDAERFEPLFNLARQVARIVLVEIGDDEDALRVFRHAASTSFLW